MFQNLHFSVGLLMMSKLSTPSFIISFQMLSSSTVHQKTTSWWVNFIKNAMESLIHWLSFWLKQTRSLGGLLLCLGRMEEANGTRILLNLLSYLALALVRDIRSSTKIRPFGAVKPLDLRLDILICKSQIGLLRIAIVVQTFHSASIMETISKVKEVLRCSVEPKMGILR